MSISPLSFPLGAPVALVALAGQLVLADHARAGELASALDPFVTRGELAGAVVAVATADRTLRTETVGWADIAAGKPMADDCLFWIASQTKPITATVVMMLVEEGRIDLDAAVESYLPEFRERMVNTAPDGAAPVLVPAQRPITVRDLLRHTSGLPFSSPAESPTLDGLPLAEAVASYAKLPLRFQPGTSYSYSNAGVNTAARILEVVTGDDYEEFLQQSLLEPLGMGDTTFWPDASQVARLAKSYRPNEAGDGLTETTVGQLTYPLSDRSRRYAMPAGGLFSTAADVTRFCRMILNDGALDGRRYLSPSSVAEMTCRQTPVDLADSYGLGWAAGDGWCGHGGAFATNMSIDRAHGLVTVYMVQHAGFPGEGARALEVFREAANGLARR